MSRKLISVCIYRRCFCVCLNQEATDGHTNAALYRFSQEWTLLFQTHNKSWSSDINFMLFFKLFCLKYSMNFPLVDRATIVLFYFLAIYILILGRKLPGSKGVYLMSRFSTTVLTIKYFIHFKIFTCMQHLLLYAKSYIYICFFYFNVHTEHNTVETIIDKMFLLFEAFLKQTICEFLHKYFKMIRNTVSVRTKLIFKNRSLLRGINAPR
jgi:hypothetical protein